MQSLYVIRIYVHTVTMTSFFTTCSMYTYSISKHSITYQCSYVHEYCHIFHRVFGFLHQTCMGCRQRTQPNIQDVEKEENKVSVSSGCHYGVSKGCKASASQTRMGR